MAKFTAVIIAAVAALAGVEAQSRACPANGLFCGSELVNVIDCKCLSCSSNSPW